MGYSAVVTLIFSRGIAVLIYSIIQKVMYGAPAGYSTLIVVMCFMFFITLLSIGIIGEYISILFIEIKDRPIYTVEHVKFHETTADSKNRVTENEKNISK